MLVYALFTPLFQQSCSHPSNLKMTTMLDLLSSYLDAREVPAFPCC